MLMLGGGQGLEVGWEEAEFFYCCGLGEIGSWVLRNQCKAWAMILEVFGLLDIAW